MPLVRNPDGPIERIDTDKKLPPTSSVVDATFAKLGKARVAEDKPRAKAPVDTSEFTKEWKRTVKERHF